MADPVSRAANAVHHGCDLLPVVVLLGAAVVAVPRGSVAHRRVGSA